MRVSSILFLAAIAATAPAQIALPKFVSTYSGGSAARGFYFQAPTNLIVTGLQVPDEMKEGLQHVALYKLTAAPPAYSATVPGTPVFFATGVPSDQIVSVVPPVIFQSGEWLMVLGACRSSTGTTNRMSYATPNHPSTVLGLPITLVRGGTQLDFLGLKGNVTLWSEAAYQVARVRVFVVGQASAIEYDKPSGPAPLPQLLSADWAPPSIGTTTEMTLMPGAASNLAGILLLGSNRTTLSVPPYGTLLVQLPFVGAFAIPGPIPVAGTPIMLPLANDAGLLGIQLDWQTLMILSATTFAMTNGLEWRIGK